MDHAAELISANGISTVALAFFTALFGYLGVIHKHILDNRRKTATVEKEVNQVVESVGGDGESSSKLDTIIDEVSELKRIVTGHLEWHVEKGNPK
jgi:hypothetical protein